MRAHGIFETGPLFSDPAPLPKGGNDRQAANLELPPNHGFSANLIPLSGYHTAANRLFPLVRNEFATRRRARRSTPESRLRPPGCTPRAPPSRSAPDQTAAGPR